MGPTSLDEPARVVALVTSDRRAAAGVPRDLGELLQRRTALVVRVGPTHQQVQQQSVAVLHQRERGMAQPSLLAVALARQPGVESGCADVRVVATPFAVKVDRRVAGGVGRRLVLAGAICTVSGSCWISSWPPREPWPPAATTPSVPPRPPPPIRPRRSTRPSLLRPALRAEPSAGKSRKRDPVRHPARNDAATEKCSRRRNSALLSMRLVGGSPRPQPRPQP
jgi:hypothetical protein